MEIKDRAYWFFRNLFAFILAIPVIPVYIGWNLMDNLFIIFFVTNGSEVINWPWEWNWKY